MGLEVVNLNPRNSGWRCKLGGVSKGVENRAYERDTLKMKGNELIYCINKLYYMELQTYISD